MSTLETLLAQSPVFSCLSESRRNLLVESAITRSYHKGDAVAHVGEIWPYLFIITKGGIHAIKSSQEGRNLVVTTFPKGDIFWGLAFFYEGLEMPVTLEAVEATQIALWPGEVMVPFLKSEGTVAWELSRLMIRKMARASEILEEMTFQPVAGRLAKLLVDTGGAEPQKAITRSLTLDEMAARIGSTREMVCRFLHRFADDGIIDITRTEFKITDQKRLLEISQNTKG